MTISKRAVNPVNSWSYRKHVHVPKQRIMISSRHLFFSMILSRYISVYYSLAYIPLWCKIPGVGGWRWAMHPTPEFCVTQRKIYQHGGIFCVGWCKFLASPKAKPQREPVEYRLRWVPNANLLRRPCTFLFFGVVFHLRWVASANLISSGIWALLPIFLIWYM